MTVRIQLRHDTEANWDKVKNTEILFQGEIGLAIDGSTVRMKVGNGIDTWGELPYLDQQVTYFVEKLYQDITLEKNATVKGVLTVSGSIEDEDYNINGISKKSVQDKDGNEITSTYQKVLVNNTEVSDNTNWNSLTDEGIYAVRGVNDFDASKNPPTKNVSLNGILIVHKDKLDRLFQLYIQDDYTIKARYYDGAEWGNWGNFTDNEKTLVHIDGYETISGEKTFADTIRSTNGIIDLHSSSVEIRKEGNPLLAQDSLGNITIGNRTVNNVITIEKGVVHGNCLNDGDGNIITETYLPIGSSSTTLAEMNDNPATVYHANQPTLYELMIEKKYNNFDMSKYTKVGNPDLADDNIVRNPDDTNKYTTSPFTAIGPNDDFKVGFKFNSDSTVVDGDGAIVHEATYGDGYIFDSNTHNDLSLYVGNDHIVVYVGGNIAIEVLADAYNLNASYRGYFERKNKQYKLWYKRVDSGALEPEIHYHENLTADTIYPLNTTSLNIGGGTGSNCDIFLNYMSLYVGDEERFYARKKGVDFIYKAESEEDTDLIIPYTACFNGTKIVDGVDDEKVNRCFYDYKTANYFVLNETTDESEQWFKMPYNNASGFCYKLYNWRDGVNSCEYDTDLECTQVGTCTNGTPVTFKKPFADNNYAIIGANYTDKNENGFTPSADGYYIAKGRITLNNNLT